MKQQIIKRKIHSDFMALFKSKRNNVLDLTERYKRQQEKLAELKAEREEAIAEQGSQESLPSQSSGGFFSFFDSSSNAVTSSSTAQTESNEPVDLESAEDRKKKLAKRLLDITNKLEEISNQIYHLQQRLEVVERKAGVNNF
ncbi:MAG: hypothetical protein PVJ67_02100 [Candidatus Pacearchaeota archaeon]